MDEEKDDSDIRIYMDSSGYKGNIGPAAVLYRKGAEEPEKVLHVYLGPLMRHTTFEGKAVGSILTAWMIQGQTEVGKSTVTSRTNSQAFIKSMGVRKSGPGQYPIMEYLRLTEDINDGTNLPTPADTAKFMLKWVAVHKGVVENERVDKEAKKAAQGELNPLEELPPALRKCLPTSTTTVKQEFNKKLKARWAETWKVLLHYARFQHIDMDLPFNKFQKINNTFSRPQANLLMQL